MKARDILERAVDIDPAIGQRWAKNVAMAAIRQERQKRESSELGEVIKKRLLSGATAYSLVAETEEFATKEAEEVCETITFAERLKSSEREKLLGNTLINLYEKITSKTAVGVGASFVDKQLRKIEQTFLSMAKSETCSPEVAVRLDGMGVAKIASLGSENALSISTLPRGFAGEVGRGDTRGHAQGIS